MISLLSYNYPVQLITILLLDILNNMVVIIAVTNIKLHNFAEDSAVQFFMLHSATFVQFKPNFYVFRRGSTRVSPNEKRGLNLSNTHKQRIFLGLEPL